MRDIKLLLTNKNYLILMVPFVINYAVHHCLSAVLAYLLAPYDYTQKQGSAMGVGYIFVGIIGSIIFARQLDINRNYLKVLRIVCFGAVVVWTLGIWALPSNNVPILALGEMLAGFFTIPIIPVGYQFGIEISYPAGEAMSNGVFSFMVQIVSLIVTYIGTSLCTDETSVPCLVFIVGLLSVSALFSLFVKEDLRRTHLRGAENGIDLIR